MINLQHEDKSITVTGPSVHRGPTNLGALRPAAPPPGTGAWLTPQKMSSSPHRLACRISSLLVKQHEHTYEDSLESPYVQGGPAQGRQRRGGWGGMHPPIILARGIQCLSSPLLLLRSDLMIFIYDKFAYCHVSSVRPSFTCESCVND